MQSTLAKLSLCRTPALGGHVYACHSCEHRAVVYNSCGDRHCPQCSGAKRRDWLDSSAQLLLPGVTYYQVVFTIPDKLSSLTLGNRQEMFDLLFRSAWRALKQTIENEQQFEAAAAMMLHTWNQHLEAHVHVHAFVPGGGPSLQKPNEWKTARPPAHKTQHQFWLVEADDLRLAFRTAFLTGLRRLQARGKLKLDGEWSHLQDAAAFEDWLQPFENVKWGTYIQSPPTPDTTPDQVLKYLARYMTGGPISDRRLVAHENGHVTFRARTGKQPGGSDETEDVRLPGAEFVRRWALHILPKGYTKTRRYGGYSNHHRQRYMTECQKLLATGEPSQETESTTSVAADPQQYRCPNCESLLACTHSTERPGWSTVMSSSHRPSWYHPTRYSEAGANEAWYNDG